MGVPSEGARECGSKGVWPGGGAKKLAHGRSELLTSYSPNATKQKPNKVEVCSSAFPL